MLSRVTTVTADEISVYLYICGTVVYYLFYGCIFIVIFSEWSAGKFTDPGNNKNDIKIIVTEQMYVS